MAVRPSSLRTAANNPAQSALWHDTVADAIGAAVHAVGGVKTVAGLLWPTLSPEIAAAKLRNALHPDHQQKLAPEEVLHIVQLAREVGDHSYPTYLARVAGYELTPLDPEAAAKRARKVRRAALLAELARLNDDE